MMPAVPSVVRPSLFSSEPLSSTSAADEAISLSNVSKSYSRGDTNTRVLVGCNLNVRRGECVYLVGPSGSGKTTLLSIIGCVLRADEGIVRIMGQEIGNLTPAEAAEARLTQIGFIFQRFHLVRGLSALDNICLPLVLGGVSRNVARRRGCELLECVGLADKAHCEPRRLSVGQCQRIAIARALVADPPLILADEPTASLDAALGQQAMRLLRTLTVELGKTAIVVTHDPRIQAFADRTFVLESGRLAEQRIAASQHGPACREGHA